MKLKVSHSRITKRNIAQNEKLLIFGEKVLRFWQAPKSPKGAPRSNSRGKRKSASHHSFTQCTLRFLMCWFSESNDSIKGALKSLIFLQGSGAFKISTSRTGKMSSGHEQTSAIQAPNLFQIDIETLKIHWKTFSFQNQQEKHCSKLKSFDFLKELSYIFGSIEINNFRCLFFMHTWGTLCSSANREMGCEALFCAKSWWFSIIGCRELALDAKHPVMRVIESALTMIQESSKPLTTMWRVCWMSCNQGNSQNQWKMFAAEFET